jgi:hypothetical protein
MSKAVTTHRPLSISSGVPFFCADCAGELKPDTAKQQPDRRYICPGCQERLSRRKEAGRQRSMFVEQESLFNGRRLRSFYEVRKTYFKKGDPKSARTTTLVLSGKPVLELMGVVPKDVLIAQYEGTLPAVSDQLRQANQGGRRVRANVQMGFRDRFDQFHPIRKSKDYDSARTTDFDFPFERQERKQRRHGLLAKEHNEELSKSQKQRIKALTTRAPKRRAQVRTLSQYVRKIGGMTPGGDLAGEVQRLSKKETGTTGLINQRARQGSQKQTPEYVMDSANEAGYGPFDDISKFLMAVEEDATGQRLHLAAEDWNELSNPLRLTDADLKAHPELAKRLGVPIAAPAGKAREEKEAPGAKLFSVSWYSPKLQRRVAPPATFESHSKAGAIAEAKAAIGFDELKRRRSANLPINFMAKEVKRNPDYSRAKLDPKSQPRVRIAGVDYAVQSHERVARDRLGRSKVIGVVELRRLSDGEVFRASTYESGRFGRLQPMRSTLRRNPRIKQLKPAKGAQGVNLRELKAAAGRGEAWAVKAYASALASVRRMRKEVAKQNPLVDVAVLQRYAESDLRLARKHGSVLIGQTKVGTVELTYDPATKGYNLLSLYGTTKVSGTKPFIRDQIVQLYDVVEANPAKPSTAGLLKPVVLPGRYSQVVITQAPGQKFVSRHWDKSGKGLFPVGPRGQTFIMHLTLEGAKKWGRKELAKFHRAGDLPKANPVSKTQKPKKNPETPAKVAAIGQTFLGRDVRPVGTGIAPPGTPKHLQSNGLAELKVKGYNCFRFNPRRARLGLDGNGNLHLVNVKFSRPKELQREGQRVDYGEIESVIYGARKSHLANGRFSYWKHPLGEEGGKRPHLFVDYHGWPYIVGGSYTVESAGIRD